MVLNGGKFFFDREIAYEAFIEIRVSFVDDVSKIINGGVFNVRNGACNAFYARVDVGLDAGFESMVKTILNVERGGLWKWFFSDSGDNGIGFLDSFSYDPFRIMFFLVLNIFFVFKRSSFFEPSVIHKKVVRNYCLKVYGKQKHFRYVFQKRIGNAGGIFSEFFSKIVSITRFEHFKMYNTDEHS